MEEGTPSDDPLLARETATEGMATGTGTGMRKKPTKKSPDSSPNATPDRDPAPPQEAALLAYYEELEAFTRAASHDMRAPLRIIDGFSSVLAEEYGDALDDTGKRYLSRIRHSVASMVALLDDLTEYSRYARPSLTMRTVNLSDFASGIIASLQATEPDRQVEAVIEPDLVAECDSVSISVALQKLIENSWKFTSVKEAAEIRVGALTDNDHVVYYVKDNGAGFDMRYVDKLFKPFQRLHSSSHFTGNGLGLATARRIITHHGGRIWAEAEVDRGATFYFDIRPEKSLSPAQ